MEGFGSTRPGKSEKSQDLQRKNTQCSLKILYTNAQSVVNKINELRTVVIDLKPDLVCINEAWTHEDITKAYLSIDGYELISRKDREDTSLGRGGGLLIYKANRLVASEIPCSTEFNQVAAVSVASKPNPLTINLVYRSPNSRAENNHKLDDFIKAIGPSTITIGDMNYVGID